MKQAPVFKLINDKIKIAKNFYKSCDTIETVFY